MLCVRLETDKDYVCYVDTEALQLNIMCVMSTQALQLNRNLQNHTVNNMKITYFYFTPSMLCYFYILTKFTHLVDQYVSLLI